MVRDVAGEAGLKQFARQLAFAYVVGASDTHAKNFSIFIMPDGSFEVAPLYDTATVLYYEPVDARHPHHFALSIGGESEFGRVTDAHWVKAAGRISLDPDEVITYVHDYAAVVPDAFHDVVEALPADVVSDLPNVLLPALDQLCRSVTGTCGGPGGVG